jgi:metal-dependent amidase/aminoacylase/carboxypeptidase family protein
MNLKVKEEIKLLSVQLFEKVNGYRRHIHAHPELSYQEVNTMNYVSEQLTKLGIEHTTKVGETGIVALIRGEQHSKEDEAIGLRADMDALPIQEENEVPYKSTVDGVMHA